MFFGFDVEIGGLAKATFNRANLLTEHGYDVTLLNIDKEKNCEYITQFFHDNNYLNDSVNLINIYDYYSLKILKTTIKPNQENYLITRKIEKTDKSIVLNHYSTNLSKNLVKSKHYFKKYYSISNYINGNMIKESFYTNDGFKFLEIKNYSFTLYDRLQNIKLEFKNKFEFYDYFLTEILLKCNNKPF